MNIEIKRVETNSDLHRFIRFQHWLYKDNPYWCPPLRFDEFNTLSRKKNAAFEYCEAEYWLAYRDGKLAGRVAGIINSRANEYWKEPLVRFGWIDFIEDFEVAEALIRTVEEWGKSKGMQGIQGPLGFTDLDREGMLVEGFQERSTFSSLYNYPYYPQYIERMGFQKATDWLQMEFTIPKEIPDKVIRTSKLVTEKYNIRVLKVKKSKELIPWAPKLFRMMNDAFLVLYGFAPISEKQMEDYTKQYFGFVRPEFVCIIVDSKDDVLGFGVSMPSLTSALQKCNGKIFPFGFYHILKAIRKNKIIDMYLLGIRPDYQKKGILSLIYESLHKAYLKNGVELALTNPQLEENFNALTVWKNYPGRQNVRRRCFIKHWN
ncbi:MAG: hypothetical protein Q8867_06885 [Bacteroidota bacterium]|nr:hypothetical protein [Bacteroidota bacterium]